MQRHEAIIQPQPINGHPMHHETVVAAAKTGLYMCGEQQDNVASVSAHHLGMAPGR